MKSEVRSQKNLNFLDADFLFIDNYFLYNALFRLLASDFRLQGNKKALPEESGTAFPCNDDLFVI